MNLPPKTLCRCLGVGQQVRLNFTLPVGGQAQSVEVNVAADTLIAATSSSVGAVLPEYKVRDLPLATRNVLDLVNTTPGVQGSNFAGGRLTLLNTTRDGTKLYNGISLNDVNIRAQAGGQTLLDAFNVTRTGGNAPLFDLMLRGLVMNAGQAAVGTGGVTGSISNHWSGRRCGTGVQPSWNRHFVRFGKTGRSKGNCHGIRVAKPAFPTVFGCEGRRGKGRELCH